MTAPAKTLFVLGVDLDGVCADFYTRLREIAAEWQECKPEDLPPVVSYGLTEWNITDYPSLHRFAVTQKDLFLTEPMIPGARKYLRMLSNGGVHIRIITHRLFINYFHAVAVEQTVKWLDQHGIPYYDLCFTKVKEQVGADLYVEDNPQNVLALRERGFETICFANSTNQHIGPPRAETWAQVYAMVKAAMAARGIPPVTRDTGRLA
jgi:uncharacterized HAD superfamily protein